MDVNKVALMVTKALHDDKMEQFTVSVTMTIRAPWWLDPHITAVDGTSSFLKLCGESALQLHKPLPPGLVGCDLKLTSHHLLSDLMNNAVNCGPWYPKYPADHSVGCPTSNPV